MEILEVLPVRFYQFQCSDDLLEHTWNKIQNEKLSINHYDGCYTSDHFFYDQMLFDWLHDCINQVTKIYYAPELKLQITGCWVNKSRKFSHTVFHDHPNSILSGVLYFSDETSSETYFCAPDPWFHAQNNNVLIVSKDQNRDGTNNTIRSSIRPQKGKLILFPSSVKHGVTTYTGSDVRYSLAFNTFFTGILTANNISSHLAVRSQGPGNG